MTHFTPLDLHVRCAEIERSLTAARGWGNAAGPRAPGALAGMVIRLLAALRAMTIREEAGPLSPMRRASWRLHPLLK